MNWLDKLERRFGKYAIKNLPLIIVIFYGIGIVMDLVTGGTFYAAFSLNPYLVLHGEPWRIITFLVTTPNSDLLAIILLVFILFFYYSMATALVNAWGAFRFNMYMLVGILCTILAAFVVYAIDPSEFIYMDTYYLNLSMFLAFAAVFPEMKVYLYGILPLKVKWLAFADIVLLAYDFYNGYIGSRIAIVVSLINFLLFFLSSRNYNRIKPKEIKRRQNYKKQVDQTTAAFRHKCAICGRTEKDDPTLDFRYCSKCNGYYEYCNDHLFTHTHVK